MSAEITVVGFVADLPGTDEHLVEVDPVVSIDGQRFVAQGNDWSREALIPLSSSDERFIHFIRELDQDVVSEGDSVWIIGKELFFDVRNVSGMREVGYSIGSWNLTGQGFRWRTGTHSEFLELSTSIFYSAEFALHGYLFGDMAKVFKKAESAYKVLSVIANADPRTQLLDRALYFQDIRDNYSSAFVAAEAVSSGVFESKGAFEDALSELRAKLTQTRLAQMAVSGDLASIHSLGMSQKVGQLDAILRIQYERRQSGYQHVDEVIPRVLLGRSKPISARLADAQWQS